MVSSKNKENGQHGWPFSPNRFRQIYETWLDFSRPPGKACCLHSQNSGLFRRILPPATQSTRFSFCGSLSSATGKKQLMLKEPEAPTNYALLFLKSNGAEAAFYQTIGYSKSLAIL
jgi:hypothetical protein